MTVELVKPFVYPEEPEELLPYVITLLSSYSPISPVPGESFYCLDKADEWISPLLIKVE